MRTYQHIIDTKAVKLTLNSIPDHWVVRDLTERDYGIDLMIEIFAEDGYDSNNHKNYNATGRICYLQVKGTNSELKLTKNTVSFKVEKKALLYVERFATPFLLIRTYTNENENKVFFLWMQRYIIDVLDEKDADWRVSNQTYFNVRIPKSNLLPTNAEKVEKIAGKIKYLEEFAEFYERFNLIHTEYKYRFINGAFDDELFEYVIKQLKRIKNLTTLLSLNHCQVGVLDIENLIIFLQDIKIGKIFPKTIEDFPDPLMFNLDLLMNDNFSRMSLESLIAENYKDTVY